MPNRKDASSAALEPGGLAGHTGAACAHEYPPALVRSIGTNGKMIVSEHTSRNDRLGALYLVGLDQTVIS